MKLEQVIQRDTRANQPLATVVPVGTLYFVTDESVTERSNGTAWETFSDAGSGSGDVTGVAVAIDGEIVLFNSTTGKLIKRATGTGIVKATAGVYSTGTVALASEVSGDLPLANLAAASGASKLLGRGDSGVGDFQELTIGTGLVMTGTVLSASGGGGGAVDFTDLADVPASYTGHTLKVVRVNAGETALEFAAVSGGITQLTGDVTAGPGSGSVAATVPAASITNAKLRNSAGLSVIGNGNSTTGVPHDLSTTTDGYVLRVSAPNLAFGKLFSNSYHDGSVTFAIIQAIATDRLLGRDAAGSGVVGEISVGNGIEFNTSNGIRLTTAARTRVIEVIIDGEGSPITTGIKVFAIRVPYACTIVAARLFADQVGSIVVDIWKDTYANYPPTVADTITASAKPTLSSADKSENTTLTGWTTSITAGDILRFNVDSVATVTWINLQLEVLLP